MGFSFNISDEAEVYHPPEPSEEEKVTFLAYNPLFLASASIQLDLCTRIEIYTRCVT